VLGTGIASRTAFSGDAAGVYIAHRVAWRANHEVTSGAQFAVRLPGGTAISSKDLRVNENVRAPQVRLIDENGGQLGVVSIEEALNTAREREIDLVEVAPNADPPVCRLMDYGKYLYERRKKEREARKGQAKVEIKEIRLRPKTDEHDIGHKLRDARRFLNKGAKVKVRINFRGREITHPEVARALLDRVKTELEDVAVVEHSPTMEGRIMLMILAPNK
jgi:translation initiation factor IF-3